MTQILAAEPQGAVVGAITSDCDVNHGSQIENGGSRTTTEGNQPVTSVTIGTAAVIST
jgi:hypothetical protein